MSAPNSAVATPFFTRSAEAWPPWSPSPTEPMPHRLNHISRLNHRLNRLTPPRTNIPFSAPIHPLTNSPVSFLSSFSSMKLLPLALSLAWTVSAFALPAAPPLPLKGHPDSTGWPELIKSDLSNTDAPPGIWTFANGILTASEDKNIWSKDSFGNCILDLEFSFEAGANSGVFLYNSDPKEWMPTSVEIQICDDAAKKWQERPANWHCGAFFGHLAPLKSTVKPAGEWNHITITCLGPKIQTLLNGETVSEVDLSQWTSGKTNPDGTDIPKWLQGTPFAQLPTKGRIGFQGRHAGAGIFFRNIKILALPAS